MDRRHFLQCSGAALALTALPIKTWATSARPERFIWITLRGGWDGLAVVAPLADPEYLKARPGLSKQLKQAKPVPLERGFVLHPALQFAAERFAARQACAHLAVATDYRQRSHFDGQAVLESGTVHARHGWLNTLAQALDAPAEAVGPRKPLLAQGPHPVAHQIHNRLASPTEQRLALLREWYRDEPRLSGLLQQAQALPEQQPGKMSAQARSLAEAMAQEQGPVLAALELSGWDSHANQHGQLNRALKQLDEVVAALVTGLGPRWQHSQIWIGSEFGRTVAENGTRGTDHGTGGLALQLSGAGGLPSLSGDWPGLAPSQRYQGRDLQPTQPLHPLLQRQLSRHFGQSLPALI
ncbi:DUF1501 domain-containing protein [Ferrimonas marina]|uniref:Uncharacterized conserved protein, DUF1501 family n=1 Tax=Ferrimonas marina TaxID=299255 RepID=A0A1M5YTF5_9GAMM|nr:DUF1501 domain-containing protein [Ferrimonas marina]SHI15407.1 Uncharacterized conserved protein, DUF1501 family [Ferrimonas marina]